MTGRRVVLFDLDGTLTDPKVGITRSVEHALRRLGVPPVPPEVLLCFIGPPLHEAFVELAGVPAGLAHAAVDAYREYFGDRGLFENVVYDGVLEMLEVLGAGGFRLGVATSKPTVFAEQILEHFGLRHRFDVVAGAELDGTRRHKQDVIRLALDRLGCGGDGCVMVGDRSFDVLGARHHGVPALGATWGYGTAAELLAAGAAGLVRRPADVVQAVADTIGETFA